jgi:hypothetical protein
MCRNFRRANWQLYCHRLAHSQRPTSFFGLAAQASGNHIIALFTTRDPKAYSNQQRGSVMNPKSKVALPAVVALGLLAASFPASADDVPDGLSVEWQGKKPCEKLYEDTQVLVARCTFPPGAVHLCHTHPSYVYYVLSGGKAEVQDEKGKRKVDVATGAVVDSPRSRGTSLPTSAKRRCNF